MIAFIYQAGRWMKAEPGEPKHTVNRDLFAGQEAADATHLADKGQSGAAQRAISHCDRNAAETVVDNLMTIQDAGWIRPALPPLLALPP